MDPEQKGLRGQLFEISGLRGKYPQVFTRDFDGQYEVCLFDVERDWSTVCIHD